MTRAARSPGENEITLKNSEDLDVSREFWVKMQFLHRSTLFSFEV